MGNTASGCNPSSPIFINIYDHCVSTVHPTHVPPGLPPSPLNPREWGSIDRAPFLTVSCLTATWRPSSRYGLLCALCLCVGSAAVVFFKGLFLSLIKRLATMCTDLFCCFHCTLPLWEKLRWGVAKCPGGPFYHLYHLSHGYSDSYQSKICNINVIIYI